MLTYSTARNIIYYILGFTNCLCPLKTRNFGSLFYLFTIGGVDCIWHIDLEIVALIFMFVIMFDVYKSGRAMTLKDKLFMLLSVASILAIISDIVSSVAMMLPQSTSWWMIQGSLLFYFILMPMLSMLWQVYSIAVVGRDDHRIKQHMLITVIPFAVFAALVLSNPFTGCIFELTASNEYIRGPLFDSIFFIFYGYGIATIFLTFVNYKNTERTTSIVLLVFPILAGLGVFLQQILTGYLITGVSFTLVLLITYLFLQNRKATRDQLTGVFNRMAFTDIVDKLSRGNDHGVVLAVAVDDFKLFNQTFGQKNGDNLLRSIADYLVSASPGRTCYRYGGDIFTIILKKQAEENAYTLAEAIMDRFTKSFYIDSVGYSVSVSIGIVKYPLVSPENHHSLLTALDFAIFQAKKRGKGQIALFNADLISQLKRKYDIMDAITKAMQNSSFEVYIQPIYHSIQKKFVYAEALLRLHDQKLGWITPSEFVPIAEETGQIIEITYFVLSKVCEFIAKNRDILHDAISISVNFSVIQFMQSDMVEKVKSIIESYDIPPSLIKIEITESVLADSFDDINTIMQKLNDFGITFALDDYGQGYSNISYLINLPFTSVKLDKSVIDKITADRAMIDALLPMFKKLNKILIAEGVETREQADILDGLCCDAIQGYYYAKPMPMDEALKMFMSF